MRTRSAAMLTLLVACKSANHPETLPAPEAATAVPIAPAATSASAAAKADPPRATADEMAVAITPTSGTKARLTRKKTGCGGTLVAGADVGGAMIEALFAYKDAAYTETGTLVVVGTRDYSEVAPTLMVPACNGQIGGSDIVVESFALATEPLAPLDAANWKRLRDETFGAHAVQGFSRPLATVPDASWKQGADEIRVLWAEVAHDSDESRPRSGGFLAIVGRYNQEVQVLALTSALGLRPEKDTTIPILALAGAGAFYLLVPTVDAGLAQPYSNEDWMREVDSGSWRTAFVWKNGNLRSAGVVPFAMKPSAALRAKWHAELVAATYEATATGLIGHETWSGDAGTTKTLDRIYTLHEQELTVPGSEKALLPSSYAAPQFP